MLERLWLDDCVVYASERVAKPSGADGLRWGVRWEGKGKLSFSSGNRPAQGDGVAAELSMTAKLFLPLEADVPPGCRVDVWRGERVFHLKGSGVPAVFSSHQELLAEVVEKWA